MVKVTVKVFVIVALVVYGALFMAWNGASQDIVTLQLRGVRFSQPLPVGALVLVGLVVGVILMAVAAWSAWAAQKSYANRAVAQIRKAKEKLQAQLDALTELRGQVAQLEARIADLKAGNGTWGKVAAGDIAVPEAGQAPPTPAADDDPDII